MYIVFQFPEYYLEIGLTIDNILLLTEVEFCKWKHYSQHLISMFARKKGVFPFPNTCVGRPMRSDRSIPITEQHNKETVKQGKMRRGRKGKGHTTY